MKNIVAIVLLTVAVIAVSCMKNGTTPKPVSSNPVVGQWKISSFVDNGSSQTSQFAAYTFSFSNNNILQISGGTMMSMCNWTFTDSIYHFNMMGMHGDALTEMDDNWKLMNFSDTTCAFANEYNIAHNRAFIMHRN